MAPFVRKINGGFLLSIVTTALFLTIRLQFAI